MKEGPGEGAENSSDSSQSRGKRKAGRDVLSVDAHSTGAITSGPDQDQYVDNRPTFINSNTIVKGENTAALVVIAVLAVFSFAALLWSSGVLSRLVLGTPTESQSRHTTAGGTPMIEVPAPQLSPISTLPVVPGKSWVAATTGAEFLWNGAASRAFLRDLSEQGLAQDLALLPAAIRPRMEQLVTTDPEVAPGGGLGPEGAEFLYALLLEPKDLNLPGPTEAVGLTCEVLVIAFQEPAVVYRKTVSHTGQGPSTSGALEMAVERCLSDIRIP